MSSNTVLRILDANFNRSREALRVMEEFARFVLDDASLTQAMKTARHDLTGAIKGLSSTGGGHGPPYEGAEIDLVLHRDIVGDVGTSISTPTESQRGSAIDVVSAACKRLTESLRSLEEYGKVMDPKFAATIEQLRYRAYEIERRLVATIRARENFSHVRLYVLITESLCAGDWFETARQALEGGADCLQLREKSLPDRELLDRARQLAQLCRDRQKTFIVNDRPDIALACGAHGVHLGQDDFSVAAARRLLPSHMIVGVSAHTIEQVEAAIAQAPDYIAVGPMFDSPTKPQPLVAGPQLLVDAHRRTSLPLVAIGGIEEGNVRSVLAGVPVCICVCRAVIAAADPADAAGRLKDAISSLLQADSSLRGSFRK